MKRTRYRLKPWARKCLLAIKYAAIAAAAYLYLWFFAAMF